MMRRVWRLVPIVAVVLAAPGPVWAQDEVPVLAVFNVSAKGLRFAPSWIEDLSEYVATRLAESGQYRVVPRDQLKARLEGQKTASYRACYDQTCQIELGRELAAQKILATNIVKLGKGCRVAMKVYDLARATSDAAATGASPSCTQAGIVAALDEALAKLTASGRPGRAEARVPGRQETPPPATEAARPSNPNQVEYQFMKLAEVRKTRDSYRTVMITGFVMTGLVGIPGVALVATQEGSLKGIGYGFLAGGGAALIAGVVGAAIYPGASRKVQELERLLGVQEVSSSLPAVNRGMRADLAGRRHDPVDQPPVVLGWSGSF